MSGASAWICRSASCPLRAVPTTRNSPEPSTISPIRRRMKALSSTTSTVGTVLDDTISLLQRPHLDPSVVEVEVDAASIVEPRVLGDERDARHGERLLRRGHIALAHVDPRAGDELAEHAGAADDLRADPPRLERAERAHLGEHDRHD